MTSLRLAWLNLARHRAATLLALVSLAVTVACAGMLLRIGNLAQARFGSLVDAGDAMVAAKGSSLDALLGALNLEGPYPRFIPLRLYATLVSDSWREAGNASHAVSAVPLVFCGRYEGHRLAGTTSGILRMPAPSPAMRLESGAWPEEGARVVVGAAVARRERLSVGDTVRVAHWTADPMPENLPAPRAFVVAGVLAPMGNAWDRLLLTNLAQSERMIREALPAAGEQTLWGSLVLHYILLHARPHGLDSLARLIDQQTVSQLVPIAETRASLERLTRSGRKAGVAVALLALILAAAALAALMLGRFEGQARQMAVLEAMGWPKAVLRRLLAWEGLMLGLGAVLLGGLLDAALFPRLRELLSDALPDPAAASSSLRESAAVWLAAPLITVAASLASSLFLFRGGPRERLRGLG